jgi:heterodisulfide reductase subunit A
LEINHNALVVGGGLAGMTVARALSGQGVEVYLVEKEALLGGNLRHLFYTLEFEGIQEYLDELIEQVHEDPLIHVYTQAQVEQIEGCVGNFESTIRSERMLDSAFTISPNSSGSSHFSLSHGVTVVATGAKEIEPDQYLYGWDERILTQRELETKLSLHPEIYQDIEHLVMIQCVDSRNEKRPYCSRVCCSQALKNALKLRELNPDAEIYILYRDLMSYGFKEEFYTRARSANITFIRYDTAHPPEVRSILALMRRGEAQDLKQSSKPLVVSVRDAFLEREISLTTDLVVLSVAMEAPEDNVDLASMLKVPLDSDGFFLEAHMKLRPSDFATDGIFLCGLAHSPKFMEETIIQAQAVASRAVTVLSKSLIESEAMVPAIDLEHCTGCGICESTCPFQAIRVVDTENGKKAKVLLAACKGCGMCGAACPYQANIPGHFTDRQLLAQITALAEAPRISGNGFEPKIVGFLCNWCAYAGADLAGVSRIQYLPNLHVVRVMCTGRIDPALIVEALLLGIDGVLILGCHSGDCHYVEGNLYAQERISQLRGVFEGVGLDPRRFRLDWVSASEGARFSEIVDDFTEHIRTLGPIREPSMEKILA